MSIVYSNCEEVELYNGVGKRSLGVRKNPGRGCHFEWQNVEPATNILHAVAREAGRVVAEDLIVLDHLPEDGTVNDWIGHPKDIEPTTGQALFRVNCGAQVDYQDPRGLVWAADKPWEQAYWGWESWGCHFDNIPDDLASRGETMTPVRGSGLQGMYRDYRYGREQLKYHFRTGPGRYRIVCHFAEPWFGVGGAADCRGWRLFDVAINGETVESKLDVWSESGGSHHALCRSYTVTIKSEVLTLHFPQVSANQALIFGIEVLPA